MSDDIDRGIAESNNTLSIEDFHKDLEPSHLDSQIAHIILAFMHNELDPLEYEKYTSKLVEIAYDLLRIGGFPTLLKILRELVKRYKDNSNPEIQSLTKNTLKKFREARFISLVVVSFEKWAKPDDRDAGEFLQFLGSIVVPKMVALYGKGERPEIQNSILKLLNRFPEKTCLEAKRRFSDSRPKPVSLILKILTEEKGTSFNPLLVDNFLKLVNKK
jgi:exoribonuclease R